MAEKYDAAMNVRMSPELSESVSARAEQAGMSRAEYIRLVLSLPIIIGPCGPKASRRAAKSRREQDFLFDIEAAFGSDTGSIADENEALSASELPDNSSKIPLHSPDNSPESEPVITSYTPSDGVAEALAKLDYCVHAGIVPQFQPRKSGRPRSDETPDRYAVDTLKIIYLTQDEIHELRVALNRWGTNYNQATHALNAIAKALREGIIEDDYLTQEFQERLGDIDALLLDSLKGLADISQKLAKLGVKGLLLEAANSKAMLHDDTRRTDSATDQDAAMSPQADDIAAFEH